VYKRQPEYRVNFVRKLSKVEGLSLRLYLGEDPPKGKVSNAEDLSGIDLRRFPTTWMKTPVFPIPVHWGLGRALEQDEPDVIVSEGHGNLFSTLAAIRYRRRHKRAAYVLWTLGTVPGKPVNYKGMRGRIKRYLQRRTDWFIVYSSWGKETLVGLGNPAERMTVAVNVTDTPRHLAAADNTKETQSQARAKLDLPDRFTSLYLGAVTSPKRLEVWLEAAGLMGAECNVVLVGDGPELPRLRSLVTEHGWKNVYTPGHVRDQRALYYRAADVLVLPGTGGMVISEAMASSLPVIAFQADGTEYDLVRHHQTGIRLDKGDAEDIRRAVEFVRDHPDQAAEWGRNGRGLISETFSQEHMLEQWVKGVRSAYRVKNSEVR